MTDTITPELAPLYDPRDSPMRTAIRMSGKGSNAIKILERFIEQRDSDEVSFEPVLLFSDNPESNAAKIAEDFRKKHGLSLSLFVDPIKEFYRQAGCNDLSDMTVRESYDKRHARMLNEFCVDFVAYAGYDWIATQPILRDFLTVNVHPGDLRVLDEDGRPKYRGLGWVPSAKAILNGENEVYTSVHMVIEKLDAGPIIAISDPQQVPKKVTALRDRRVLLGEADSIGEIQEYIRENPEVRDVHLAVAFPLHEHALDCQERLKIHGDLVIFPQAIVDISLGIMSLDEQGRVYKEGIPVLK